MVLVTYDKLSRVVFWGAVSGVAAGLLNLLGLVSFTVAFLTLWALSSATYLALASLRLAADGKTVLITGCDSGFGHSLALHLDALGFEVVACCLNAEGEDGQRLRQRGSGRLHVLQMDITSHDQITKVLHQVTDILGSQGSLWGIVNNAGIHSYGAVEWVSLATYKKFCDVNLFGTIAVTKAFLPLIRRAKGRVVTVGSLRGRQASPLGSAYEITKFGLEALNDCLRMEMKYFGVDVCLIEPGNHCAGTRIIVEDVVRHNAKVMWAEMSDEVKAAYGEDYYNKCIQKQIKLSGSGDSDVSKVLEAMTEALTQRFPQGRYQPADATLYAVMLVSQHFPEWIGDFVFANWGWMDDEERR